MLILASPAEDERFVLTKTGGHWEHEGEILDVK